VYLDASVPLLPKEFHSKGYSTAAFLSSVVLLGDPELQRGFDVFDGSFWKGDLGTPERRAEDTLAPALTWIQKQPSPWFCWIHLFDPHEPYAPPQPYAKRFQNRLYDGEVAYMDHALGVFLGELSKSAVFRNTVLVICADHGESLGEHGEANHGFFIYEATTHVPLIVRLPGQTTGKRIETGVGLVDVAPTIREICSLEKMTSDGTSLALMLKGGNPQHGPVYIESLEPLYTYGWAPLFGSVCSRKKFVLAPRCELYDLDEDPSELNNLCGDHQGDCAERRKELLGRLKFLNKAPREFVSSGERELNALEGLGYLGGIQVPKAAAMRDPKDGKVILERNHEVARLLHEGRGESAVRILESLIPMDPANPALYYEMGLCAERNYPLKAIENYRKAVNLQPSLGQAHMRLTSLLLSLGKAKDAFAAATMGVKMAPFYRDAMQPYLAWAAFASGEPDEVVESYLKGTLISGQEDPLAIRIKAALCLRQGRKEEAIGWLETFAHRAPPQSTAALESDAYFADLHQEPRFWKLVIEAKQQLGGNA
jgi:tetratricopeptide (TPR) repeat protein